MPLLSDAQVLAEIERRRAVPSCRVMAAALGVSRQTVHRAYARLGLRSAGRRRPAHRVVRGRFHVSVAAYEALCRQARARYCSVSQIASVSLERAFNPKRDSADAECHIGDCRATLESR